MFARSNRNSLEVPPNARNPAAVEVLRVWAVPGEAQQLVLNTTWKEAGAWGLLLADVARHAAKAYANEGRNEYEVFTRIRQFFEAEMTDPRTRRDRFKVRARMAGSGPLAIRALGRRMGRDVKTVHGDVQALLSAGVLDRNEDGLVVFPYDAVHVDFILRAA
jgi:hypothetical protein